MGVVGEVEQPFSDATGLLGGQQRELSGDAHFSECAAKGRIRGWGSIVTEEMGHHHLKPLI